jgi:sulfonate transport system substrate-binding protein
MRLLTLLALFSSLLHAEEAVVRIGVGGTGVAGRPVMGGNVLGYLASRSLLEKRLAPLGVRVEWNFLPGAGPAVNEAFANGLLDFSWCSEQVALVARSSGIRLRTVLAAGRETPNAVVVLPDSKITKVEELRGRKVALFKGTGGQLAADRILEAHGLKEKDLAIQNITNAALQNSLASRQVEAAFVGTSQAFQFQDQGLVRILYSSLNDPRVQGLSSGLQVSESFEAKNPKLVQLVVDAFVEASQKVALEENKEEVLREWSRSGTPYTVWKRDLEGVSLKRRFDPRIDTSFVRLFGQSNRDLVRYGLLRSEVDLQTFLEPKYVRNAVARLGLDNFWE